MEKVDAGSKLAHQAGATMDEVVSSVKRVSDSIAEMTAASNEQRAGIEQVNQAMTQMDQVTPQNTALVEQASAAAEAMKVQSASLAQTVSVFKLDQQSGMPTATTAPKVMPLPSQRKALQQKGVPTASADSRGVLSTRTGTTKVWERF